MEYKPIFSDDQGDALEHYGVMGMKWGVRNAETLRKYAGDKGGKVKKRAQSEYSDYKARRAVKAKRARMVRNRATLSDKEIETLTNRLTAEKKLKQLHGEQDRPIRYATKDSAKHIVTKASKTVLTGAATGALAYKATKIIAKAAKNEQISENLSSMLLKGISNTLKK